MNKNTAGRLALFLGGLGIHKFYLGDKLLGFIYLFFCITGIPAFIALIDAIVLFTMTEESFNKKYFINK